MQELEQLLLSEAPDAYVLMDLDGTVLYWNRCAQQIFGYAADEVLGKHLGDFIVPAERKDEESKIFRQTIECGQAECESIRRRKDGVLLYLSVSNKLLRDAGGNAQYVLSCKRDISSARVQRDASLIAARFHGLLESMPDGIVMVNALGRIVLANSQAGKLFGWNPLELRGNSIEVLMPQRFRDGHAQLRTAYLMNSRARAMGAGLDLSGLRQDGSEFPLEISLSPLTVEGEAFVLSAIRDISERKRIEQVLWQKNKELEEAARAKNRFLANVSHELRTPLNAIMGFTDLLLMSNDESLSDEREPQLQIIQKSAAHLLELIEDMLDVSRIEASQIKVSTESVICSALLQEAVDAFRQRAISKGVEIKMAPLENDLPLVTDPRILAKILGSLTDNAIKFTEAGEVVLGMTQNIERHILRTRITVTDTGCGISKEDQSKLFQPLAQLDASASRRHEGTGLGLYLGQRLAHLLSGRIFVESTLGKGSVFTLEINQEASDLAG